MGEREVGEREGGGGEGRKVGGVMALSANNDYWTIIIVMGGHRQAPDWEWKKKLQGLHTHCGVTSCSE